MACLWASCGGEPRGEVEGRTFARCAQMRPPAERSVRVGALALALEERVLTVQVDGPVRIAAFAGPVGRGFRAQELRPLASDRPALALWLGGLGDDERQAQQSLRELVKLHIPTVFVAGGADRYPVIEAAFAALAAEERDWVLNGSGLRVLQVGDQRFAIAAGAVGGRYALGEHACGLAPDDLAAIRAEAGHANYVLSWHATAGAGVVSGEGVELGSPELADVARTLGARGGLFAFPEPPGAGSSVISSTTRRAWVVPRLGAPGSLRADGARLDLQLGRFQLDGTGLAARP